MPPSSVDTPWTNCHTPPLFCPQTWAQEPLISSPTHGNSIRMEAIFAHSWLTQCANTARFALLVVAILMSPNSYGKESADDIPDFTMDDPEDSEVMSSDAAKFDKWESIFEENEGAEEDTASWNDPTVKTIDWMRCFGFRHSSSSGRHTHKGIPLEGTSWLNRPYHVDWFVGTLLGDELITDRVNQNNEVMTGLRIGCDFDYFWGAEWRMGWSNPDIDATNTTEQAINGSYFITDVDLKYYPWGDSVVRPYWLAGFGMTQIDFRDHNDISRNVSLLTMPFGTGVEFHQWPWLVCRLEVLDNLAFGADGVNTLNNFSFTAGLEYRFGAKPQSYWPWRTSRRIW
ncbi:outer membrane beta-barrel protein [Bythopirellula polymerisocia]|nr:outer membrane beta-barrel protein [Bythopirellula polymerisocia]